MELEYEKGLSILRKIAELNAEKLRLANEINDRVDALSAVSVETGILQNQLSPSDVSDAGILSAFIRSAIEKQKQCHAH